METLDGIVLAHEFFAGLDPEFGKLIAGCARNQHFEPGAYLVHQGDPAREFYVVRYGEVALEITSPGRKTVVLRTIRDGEIVGGSWLAAPYRWTADARALTHVHAIGFDAESLRAKCEEDPRIGYELLKRFTTVVLNRLETAYLQLLDMYGRTEGT
jgi:CRP-like cAMP-binding protein